ncbi:uncharacterized protein A1O5_11352 [Cladophialophora psammophila CBS 110553]|uniref:Uncharacterized protein n=1 Tax=Cladophialophora psammophila CBS 110553 TaxID=1182543 RepID=W9WG71_9EURO|nr:uncharacterized protein A1O5_11352 [Cladophialophora psammophila CBS 110553]EXJ63591.1 hypothetical protein A1O5_11352 [Cladophialophora psammophila CBS 110553]
MSVLRPPREGITLEYLFRPVHHVLLQPLVPASLLLLHLKYARVFQRALSFIGTSVVQSKFINRVLVGLLTFGILDKLNSYLSRQVPNNFVRDKSWDWHREIVLITGAEEELQRTFDVNILAHFKMVKEFLPDMIRKNHGHVVTIASMSSFATWAGITSYAATKAAALAFHEALAQELRARYRADKVRTTIVHPVWVRTPLSHGLVKKMASNQFLLEPGTVAEAVVSQVLKCEGNQLILPARLNFVPFMRGWPSWLQENARSDGAQVVQSHN